MLIWVKCRLFLFSLLVSTVGLLHAQEETENIGQAKTYLDARTRSLEKFLQSSSNLQQNLLKKLSRKEDKLLRKLAAKDSAAYLQYIQQQPLRYDSIAGIAVDTFQHSIVSVPNRTIDSLKGIQRFIQNESTRLSGAGNTLHQTNIAASGDATLDEIRQKLQTQLSIDRLIKQHTADLSSMASTANIKGLESIQKNVYYAREQIKAYRQLANEPDEAEAKALECLLGVEGFHKYLQPDHASFGGLGNDATAGDLQRMGYQTKSQVNDLLQQKLGDNLSAVQDQMGEQLQQYSEKLNDLKKTADKAKGSISEAKQTLKEVKETKGRLPNITKPGFRVNEERCKPFFQRLEWQYNFQTTRASVNALKPAIMNLAIAVAYKQSPKISFVIGLGLNMGLGQNWQHLKLSYEGITLKAFADWKWQYGISLQAGYERTFIPAGKPYLLSNSDTGKPNQVSNNSSDNTFKNAFGGKEQSAYIGLQKRYKMNHKWSGTFLVGYNFLWQQNDVRSPWVLKFGWVM